MNMAYIDLILNLALLVALSVLSGFIDKRWPRDTWPGALLQGFLFGVVAIIGMLRPLVMGPGLIFDGRSIIISLCALFFGHRAASVTGAMTAAYRLALGGHGVVMGVSVVLASAVIGLGTRHYIKPLVRPPSTSHLFFLGLAV
ncbi:MAG TPA: PAS domain-containing sensor histidine kinase, partial [Deltaproteobacteria bacterium]|nr:PAS domain-containing sensor histidine kinase [Deltaproteobacteria bacterium]